MKTAPSGNGKIGPKSAKFDPCDLERSKFKILLPTIFAPLWVLTLCQVWFGLVENCNRNLNLFENWAQICYVLTSVTLTF